VSSYRVPDHVLGPPEAVTGDGRVASTATFVWTAGSCAGHPKWVATIFLSYRRAEAGGHAAGRLYDSLIARFGEERVFMDVDMPPGVDFVDRIQEALAQCDVLVAVIGDHWADAIDDRGRRRLDDPDDLVRLEVEAALARPDVAVIPVLIGDARLPGANALPDSLTALSRRQAFPLRTDRWRSDVAALVSAIERHAATRAGLQPAADVEEDAELAEQRRRFARGDDTAAAHIGWKLVYFYGDYRRAEDAFREGDARSDGESADGLGVMLERRGALDAAEAAYRRAESRGALYAPLHLGLMLGKRGDISGAKAAYLRAERAGVEIAALRLGELLESQGDMDGAERAYRRGDGEAALRLGELLWSRGDLDGAEAALRRADKDGVRKAGERLSELLRSRGKQLRSWTAALRAKAREVW
jgi:hypothetical protein